MFKQIFDRNIKMLGILLAVSFLISVTATSVSATMNPSWGERDKKHYLDGWNEGYKIGLINGYDQGYDMGIKGMKYSGTVYFNFAPKGTTPQDIGYADGYNAGYNVKFLSGYYAGYDIYKRQHLK